MPVSSIEDMTTTSFDNVSSARFFSVTMNENINYLCGHCAIEGCDVKVEECGCFLHVRCLQSLSYPMRECPQCASVAAGLTLIPISLHEVTQALEKTEIGTKCDQNEPKVASTLNSHHPEDWSSANHSGSENSPDFSLEFRTGRWTVGETEYVNKLAEQFEWGFLPLVDGIKFHEFLGRMLKSQQSRLTKNMKNAKLPSKLYKRTTGYMRDINEARKFSESEIFFFDCIDNDLERALMKVHIRKEWMEMFSMLCGVMKQPLKMDKWLQSVEELDQQILCMKNTARRAFLNVVGKKSFSDPRLIISQDINCRDLSTSCHSNVGHVEAKPEDITLVSDIPPSHGTFVGDSISRRAVRTSPHFNNAGHVEAKPGHITSNLNITPKHVNIPNVNKQQTQSNSITRRHSLFLQLVINYIQSHGVPFEHADAWIPSFSPIDDEKYMNSISTSPFQLYCTGYATAKIHRVNPGSSELTEPIAPQQKQNFHEFGEYSQGFCFDICQGSIPGKAFKKNDPTWDRNVNFSSSQLMPRVEGYAKCGIKTVVGIPVNCPVVGKLVVLLYSMSDRLPDQQLSYRLNKYFTRLEPTPKWQLLLHCKDTIANTRVFPTITSEQHTMLPNDINEHQLAPITKGQNNIALTREHTLSSIISLLTDSIPIEKSFGLSPPKKKIMSLRLLFLKPPSTLKVEDKGLVDTFIRSYKSYMTSGRNKSEMAQLLIQEYEFLVRQ